MSPEKIAEKYGPRALAILERIAERLRAKGHQVTQPEGWSGDRFQWGMSVHPRWNAPGDHDHDIGIDFEINESEDFDGTRGGMNFSLEIVEFGGRIIGGLTPFNYSDKVWVRRSDPKAVEERFRIFEGPRIVPEAVHLIETEKTLSVKDWCPADSTGIVPPVENRGTSGPSLGEVDIQEKRLSVSVPPGPAVQVGSIEAGAEHVLRELPFLTDPDDPWNIGWDQNGFWVYRGRSPSVTVFVQWVDSAGWFLRKLTGREEESFMEALSRGGVRFDAVIHPNRPDPRSWEPRS